MALVEDVATIGQIDKLKYAEYLSVMVPLLLEFAEDKCNNKFDGVDENGNLEPPTGVKVFIAESIKHNLSAQGITSRSMGSVSYSYDTDLPEKIVKHLKPYKKLRW
ncbi:phage head-tail connector protein [Virgibacillus halodenitrificans]|uniref:Phage gp6-like head-tail connector protein n=1 Tax=Virgibacillus halodenitrificans TaxID=1482 RepID=A0ABR7VN01_VIRHA|nr:phage head-tail connector protein [Virgibacillus halodenitrificans]MBD1223289.1 hypothetical protein [Virgibacillus halodenitrificans]